MGAAGAAQQAKPAQETFSPNPGKVIIPTEVVQESFKKVFLEDLLVLVMFVALVGVLILAFMDPSTIDGPTADGACEVGPKPRSGAEAFFVIAALWSCMYMKCSCCANKVSVTKGEMAKKFPEKYGHLDEENNVE